MVKDVSPFCREYSENLKDEEKNNQRLGVYLNVSVRKLAFSDKIGNWKSHNFRNLNSALL